MDNSKRSNRRILTKETKEKRNYIITCINYRAAPRAQAVLQNVHRVPRFAIDCSATSLVTQVFRLDEDVDIRSTTSGFYVGWTAGGEYLRYTVDVQTDGKRGCNVHTLDAGIIHAVPVKYIESSCLTVFLKYTPRLASIRTPVTHNDLSVFHHPRNVIHEEMILHIMPRAHAYRTVDAFDFDFIVAAPPTQFGSFRVVAGGNDCSDFTIDLSGPVTVEPTGGWATFATISV